MTVDRLTEGLVNLLSQLNMLAVIAGAKLDNLFGEVAFHCDLEQRSDLGVVRQV